MIGELYKCVLYKNKHYEIALIKHNTDYKTNKPFQQKA